MDALPHPISPLAFNWDHWCDLPFEKGGRGPSTFDCWGLVRAVLYAAKGVEVPSFLEYENSGWGGDASQVIFEKKHLDCWKPVPLNEAQPFDVIVFLQNKDGGHVGIIVSKGKFLHVGRGQESGIDRYTSISWRSRIEGVYRYQPT